MPRPDPAVASIGHQIVGIVLRDLGETEAALRELRTAVRLARRSGDADRWGDVLATLGLSLSSAGWIPAGTAEASTRRCLCSTVCPSRASWCVGPTSPATCSPCSRRVPQTCGRRGGSSPARATRSGRARVLNLAGARRRRAGGPRGCRASIRVVRRVSPTPPVMRFESGLAEHNTGWLGFVRGDLPLALSCTPTPRTLRCHRTDQRRPRVRPVPRLLGRRAGDRTPSTSSRKRSSRDPCSLGRRRTC